MSMSASRVVTSAYHTADKIPTKNLMLGSLVCGAVTFMVIAVTQIPAKVFATLDSRSIDLVPSYAWLFTWLVIALIGAALPFVWTDMMDRPINRNDRCEGIFRSIAFSIIGLVAIGYLSLFV